MPSLGTFAGNSAFCLTVFLIALSPAAAAGGPAIGATRRAVNATLLLQSDRSNFSSRQKHDEEAGIGLPAEAGRRDCCVAGYRAPHHEQARCPAFLFSGIRYRRRSANDGQLSRSHL